MEFRPLKSGAIDSAKLEGACKNCNAESAREHCPVYFAKRALIVFALCNEYADILALWAQTRPTNIPSAYAPSLPMRMDPLDIDV